MNWIILAVVLAFLGAVSWVAGLITILVAEEVARGRGHVRKQVHDRSAC